MSCILEEHGMRRECKGDCENCGWNPEVVAERHEYLKEHGYTLCEDGLKRLIMEDEKCSK